LHHAEQDGRQSSEGESTPLVPTPETDGDDDDDDGGGGGGGDGDGDDDAGLIAGVVTIPSAVVIVCCFKHFR
jgi:hypothetical protein